MRWDRSMVLGTLAIAALGMPTLAKADGDEAGRAVGEAGTAL